MNLFLAQMPNVTPDNAHQITLYLIGALGALGIMVSIYTALARAKKDAIDNRDSIPRTLSPNPLRVEAVKEPITKEQCERMHVPFVQKLTDLDLRIREVDHDLQTFKQAVLENGEERKNFIVQRVDDVRKELSAEINSVHKRVDGIPERIMAMLRNVKGLIP
jgi:hypothetical protein